MSLRYDCTCWQCVAAGASMQDPHAAGTALADPPSQPQYTYNYTGDYRIDALLERPEFRWNAASEFGAPVQVTYSFMSAKPIYGGTDEGGDFAVRERTADDSLALVVADVVGDVARVAGFGRRKASADASHLDDGDAVRVRRSELRGDVSGDG